MNANRNEARRGFTLVELLAVVLILGVLAAIAVPLYMNSRKAAAARACKANITAIAAAESTYALRNGVYCVDTAPGDATTLAYVAGTPPTGGLVGAPEGLSYSLKCPLDGTTSYTVTGAAAQPADITITCGNAATHATVVPDTTGHDYVRVMVKPAAEGLP